MLIMQPTLIVITQEEIPIRTNFIQIHFHMRFLFLNFMAVMDFDDGWLLLVLKRLLADKRVKLKYAIVLQICPDMGWITRQIELVTQALYNLKEGVVLFLHLLMMAAALLGLSGPDEVGHCFEDFVHPSQMSVDEVVAVDLQKPVVSFVLLLKPMTCIFARFLTLLFGLGFRLGTFQPLWSTFLLDDWCQILLLLLKIIFMMVGEESEPVIKAWVFHEIVELLLTCLLLVHRAYNYIMWQLSKDQLIKAQTN